MDIRRSGREASYVELAPDATGRVYATRSRELPLGRFQHLGPNSRRSDPTLAEAILDRIVHNAHRIQLRGESLRRKRAQESAMA